MEFLGLAIFIALLLPVCNYLVPFVKKSARNTWIFAGILGVILIPVTLFILNQRGLILPQQTEVIEWVAGNHSSTSQENQKYEWVKRNFVFIDNSFSNQLVDKPRSNVLGNSTIPITNREELTRLFQTLQQGDSLVDLIVCDIFMDIPTPADSALREVLTDQGIESKLLLAHNLVNPNTDYFASLNDSVYGNVVESGYEHSFAVFKPYHKGRPSLAYLIYRKVGQLETGTSLGDLLVSEKKKNRWRSFGINCYIPHFELTQEDKIYDDNGEKGDQQHLVSQNNYFEIGDVVTYPVQQQSLLHTLYQRKSEGMKNIIFIGSFKGTSEDVHPTYYGRLHGATILLNLFCSLQAHQHRLSIWFLIYLWFFISCILFIAVRKGLGTPLFSALSAKPTPKTSIRKKNKILMGLKDSIVCIWHILILDELHFWLFAIFIFGTAIVWDRIINGLVLFILLQLIYKVFQYYAHTHKAVTANQKIRERD